MTRIALISDLHGNDLALNAVLEDVRRVGADRVVCLGDVATLGPRPREVLARLRDLGCLCIMGNHDAFLLDEELIHGYSEVPAVVQAVDWCRDQLSADDLAFVRTFRDTAAIPGEADATLLVFHGSPRSHLEEILSTTPPPELDAMLAGHAATVMAGGHTHVPMVRQHAGRLLVNPGSLGLPFREPIGAGPPHILAHAAYATIDLSRRGVDVSLRRVRLEPTALIDQLEGFDCSLAAMLYEAYSRQQRGRGRFGGAAGG